MGTEIYVVVEHLRGQVMEISYIMLAAARAYAAGSEGEVVALLLGNDTEDLAKDFNADRVLYLEHPALTEFTPDAYLEALAPQIEADTPRAVLLGHTTIGMDVASGLSARLGLPMVSQCQQLSADQKFTSKICGGKIMVQGLLPEPTALVTMIPGGYKSEAGRSDKTPSLTKVAVSELKAPRVKVKEYFLPEAGDVDISRETLLVAVGRGLQNQDDLDQARELAQALGGTVCASRPIVDQGWLPTTRLVGKSGLHVKPKVYLALGISGAPEHVEAITDSDLIVAINTDPDAPIFELAQFGADIDLYDFIPAMLQQLQQLKV